MSDHPLYRRLLGPAWHELPPAVRALHGSPLTACFGGRARVTRGPGWRARLAAAAFGFPRAGDDVPVAVTFERAHGTETWVRHFAGRVMASRQREGHGSWSGLLVERFGPVSAGLALTVEDGRLHMRVRRWSFLGMPMPMAWAPSGDAFEAERDGTFCFHVEIAHPLTGPVVTYRGWLRPNPRETVRAA